MDEDDIPSQDELEMEEIPSEEEDKGIDIASYKINNYPADMTLELLSNKLDSKEIIIPKFQRRYVWPIIKASRLVESFLLGLPVPQIFLYRDEKTEDLLVVDGQQRLRSINYFFKNEFPEQATFKLKGVKERWEGKSYDDLQETEKRRLKNSILRATIFEQTDPEDNTSIFEIFERLNTGGMSLNSQEIRNCVIQGRITDFLNKINLYENWRILLGKQLPDKRMRDIEMILRFFALYESGDTYKKPMKNFISDFMRKHKDLTPEEEKKYEVLFKHTIDNALTKIGDYAFKIRRGINISVFDSVTVALAKTKGLQPDNLKDRFRKLVEDQQYLSSIAQATTNSDKVAKRIEIAISYFSK